MVQIIPRDPSRLEGLMQSLNQGLSGITSGAESFKNAMQQRQMREALGERFGKEFSKVTDPNILQKMVQEALVGENQQRKTELELAEGLRDYETIKRYFGEDTANIYKAASTGGKTKIFDALVDSLERGEKFGDRLSGTEGPEILEEPQPDIEEIVPRATKQKFNLPDYSKRPKGYSRKEWATHRNDWAKKNNEILDNARKTLRGNKRDILATKKLQQLSKNLPEGLEKWMINPNTGEIYGLAQLTGQAPKAAQEWVKEIARFGNRAKDAYGSRVTNFDLVQYMKQFPSLLNTKEGRDSILRMMEINYELDSLYDKAVQQIIDQAGANKIPPPEVDRIARGIIADKEQQLFDEYLNLESENEQEFMQEGMSNKRPSLEEIFG